MKTFILSLLLVSASYYGSSQEMSAEDSKYVPLVEAGEAALKNMNYDSCMIYYKDAFKIRQTSYLSTLRNAACAYSAEEQSYMDEQLKIAFDLSWGGSNNIYNNYPEFEYLKETPFDKMIEDMYISYATEAGVDMAMMEEFENIMFEDQRYRMEMDGVEKEYGWQSPQMDSLWVLQNAADSINTLRITEILDTKGYPGKSMVGDGLASTAFLVIQHADLEIQEKYLSIIKQAADDGEVRWSSVALLIDRINMRNGKPQMYGSQLNTDQETGRLFFARIAQPFKIDSVRATVGLGTLQSYADNWELTWSAEEHVKFHDERDAKKAMEEKEDK